MDQNRPVAEGADDGSLVDGDQFGAAGSGSADGILEALQSYNPGVGFHDQADDADVYKEVDEEDVYRGLAVEAAPQFNAMPMDDAAFERVQSMTASAAPKMTGGLPKLFETLDVPSLPALPPMPAPKDMSMLAREEPASIPSITKCPIKSYTTFKMKRDTATPTAVTDAVASVLKQHGVECKMLQKGLKLRGSIVSESDKGTETTIGYESMGSVSFVFQLFYSEDNAHLMGVFRRLCGDVIAFNDKYRMFMRALQDTPLAAHIL